MGAFIRYEPHPWLVQAIEFMETAPKRVSVAQLREALGDPTSGAHPPNVLLAHAEAKGYVHSIGQGVERRFRIGAVPLPSSTEPEPPPAIVGRGAPRVASVWAWASGEEYRPGAHP